MANDTLYMTLELKDNLHKQLEADAKDIEKIAAAVKGLNKVLSEDEAQKNITKNVQSAEKALYKLLEAKEKVDKALSRNASMRNEGFLGVNESELLKASGRIDEIIDKIMKVGVNARYSGNAVKDLLASLSSDLVIKSGNTAARATETALNKQVREQAKNNAAAEREWAKAEKDTADAAARNASNQERVSNAIQRVAIARSNLNDVFNRSSQSEQVQIRMMITLLDEYLKKLNAMKGQFLGDKGALTTTMGGLGRVLNNVKTSIRDIGNVTNSVEQKPVTLISNQDVSTTLNRIDAIGAAFTRLQKLLTEMDNWKESPRSAMQMALSGNWNRYAGNYEQQMSVFRDTLMRVKKELDDMSKAGVNISEPKRQLDALFETFVKLEALKPVDLASKLGIEHLRGYTGPQKSLSDETWQTLKREQEAREVAAAAAEKHRKKLAELTDAFDKQAKAEERERQAQARSTAQQEAQYQARQRNAQATRKQAEELVRLRMELLKTQSAELQNLMRNGKGVLNAQQFNEVRDALRSVREEMRQLETVMQRMSSYSTRDLLGFGRGTQNWSPLITHTQEALDASRAVSLLSDSERRFVESLSQASAGLREHGVLLRDIQMLATQYLSLWGAKGFLDKIIETGGLLEQQRLSISAILGSMDKANVVFGKIKDLAIKSPFGVVELDKMSKQLTAYGFEYEELFDWTKRLADISAATGTEVSRLALALGHVRAEGALSGYTLRQFSMANVPLLQNLANNLGITAKEVREKTKKKEIGYEDVKKVLQDLTDDGGMFYNAQEVMSQALNAKFKNLRDAFDIMYGEIAESGVGDLLKKIAEALTAGAKEWRRFGTDILWVASAFAVMKAALYSYRAGMAAVSKELGLLAYNTRNYTSLELRQLAVEGQVTRAQLLRAVASGRLTVAQAKLAGSTLGVSEATLKMAAASGTVSKAMLGNAMATSRYSVAQLRMIATMKAQGAMFPVLRVGLMGLAAGFRAVGAAVKSFLPFLAIGAIVDVFSRYSQQVSSAKEAATDAASTISTGFDNIKDMYDSLNKKPPQGLEEITSSVENMKEVLKDNGGYSSIQAQVEGTKDVNAQYEILYNRLKEIADGYTMVKYSIEGYLAAANMVGGGWFTDTMEKDIKQFGEATIKKEVAKGRAEQFAKFYKQELETYLKAEGKWNEEVMRNMGWEELYEKYGDKLVTHIVSRSWVVDEKDKKLYEDAGKALKDYATALFQVREAQKEVDSQMPEYAEHVKLAMKAYSEIFQLDTSNMLNWSDEDLRMYVDKLGEVLGSMNIPEEAKNHIRDEIINTFPKEVQTRIRYILSKDQKDEKALTGWRKELQDYFDKNKIQVKLSADDSIQKVEKQLKEARDKAQSQMDSAGAILTYWKIKPDLSAVEALAKKNPMFAALIKGAYEAFEEAKKDLEKIDQAHKDTGLSVADDKKGKSGGSGSKSSGSKVDKELNEWKKRIQLLDKYRQELEKLSQFMSRDAAEMKLKADDNFSSLWLFGDPNDYERYLRGAIDKLGTKGDRGTFANELKAKIGDEQLRVFTKDAEDATNELKKMLDLTQKNYEVYKKWYDLTGDAELAARIANVIANGSYADVLRSKYGELGGADGMSAEAFFGLSESEAKKYGEKSGLFALWKEWEENVKSLRDENLKLYEEAVKNSKDYDAQIADINRDLEKQIAAINELTASEAERERLIREANRRADEKKSKVRWDQFKKENNYDLIAENLDSMPLDELKKMVEALRDFSDNTQLSTKEMKAWKDAMKKITDQMAVLNPLEAIKTGALQYDEARRRREDLENEMSLYNAPMGELRRMGIKKEELRPFEDVKKEYLEALADEGAALKIVTQGVKALANSISQLGSSLQSIGSSVGGRTGDVFNGLGSIFSGLGKSMDALTNVQSGKGFGAMMSRVSAVATVVSAMIEMNMQLSKIMPSSEGNYEHYAEKAREVNKLREAVDDYALSVAKAKTEEDNWFGGSSLSKMRSMGEQARTTLENYYKELYEPQEIYKNKGSGLNKWGVPIAAGIAAIAGVAATAMTGGAAGVAILGAMASLESVVGTVAATAIAGAIVGGVGAAAGQIAQGVVNGITYGKGQTDARSNMRIQTRHKSFWRGQKTQGLEEWVRNQLSMELFDDEGLVNLEAAEQVLEKYGDKLVGDTKDTLERLVELRKEYDEFIKNIQEYVGDIGSSLQDSMVNALWDWLSDGEDAMDSFYEYASETFRKLSQDIVKMFLKTAIFDRYSKQLEELFKQWSLGEKGNAELIQEMGVFSTLIAQSFEGALPMAQQLASLLDETFGAAGYDIKNTNGSGRSSASNSIKAVTENTADILAGYINAIRADVSVNRITIQQILLAVQSQAQLPVIAEAQLNELRQITVNTGNTALNTEGIGEILSLLRANTLGANSFSIR